MHKYWEELIDVVIPLITEKFGSSIYDPRCEKSWDPGQAFCACLYGPNWSSSEEFLEDNEIPADEAPSDRMIDLIIKMKNGNFPDWMTDEAVK